MVEHAAATHRPLGVAAWTGQALLFAAFALVIGVFSRWPVYHHLGPDQAVIKVSFAHTGKPVSDCRPLSAEELAKLGDRILLLIGAALFCQLRLLANMLDGMVAVEAGKGGPDGPVWNELPDRFADIFILVGAGYGVAATGMFDATLGWAAAVAAVMTAYVREVVRAAGAPADFSGPMAKPHRMFWMTMAALASIFDPQIGPGAAAILDWGFADDTGIGVFIAFALWLVLLGSILTVFSRTARGLRFLRKR